MEDALRVHAALGHQEAVIGRIHVSASSSEEAFKEYIGTYAEVTYYGER